MLRFATRDLKRGYLCGVVCSADNRSNFLWVKYPFHPSRPSHPSILASKWVVYLFASRFRKCYDQRSSFVHKLNYDRLQTATAMLIGRAGGSGLPTDSLNSRPRWVIISCSCASTSSNPFKILFSPGAESSDPARLTGRPSSFECGNCGIANGDMGTTSVCSVSVFPFAKKTGPVREAVKGLSRSGDGAAFTRLLRAGTGFDLGSGFPPVFHMEEPSS